MSQRLRPSTREAARDEIAPEARAPAAGKALNLGCCRISFEGRPGRR